MSRHTTTSTSWGEMRVTPHADSQTLHIHSRCKICFKDTEQTIPDTLNPFEKVLPRHRIGCRFHPDTPPGVPQMPIPETRTAITHAVLRSPVSRADLLWVIGLLMAGLAAGAFLR